MSDTPEQPDLAFIGHQLARLINEVATLRDDVNVLAAIVRRIDNRQERMLDEIRAMHSQHNRLGSRVRALEEKTP
jgi:ubiquinone biosynthesis protein UbiJ